MKRAGTERGRAKARSIGGGVAELSFIIYSDYL